MQQTEYSNPVTICAAGDIMPGDSSICVGWGMGSRWVGRDFQHVLSDVAGTLSGADVAIANLESPLTTRGEGRTRWSRDQMRGLPDAAMALKSAGLTAVSVANNHAMQHGTRGFEETVRVLRDTGLQVVGLKGTAGWNCEPVLIPVRGTTVGILGYSWRPQQYGGLGCPYADCDLRGVVQDVARLRRQSDIVVVSLHWGDEFYSQPSDKDRNAAKTIAEAGADLIFGHHPHVVRPIQNFERCLVAYSLGNLASDMVWYEPSRKGIVLEVAFDRGSAIRYGTQATYTDDEFRTRLSTGGPPQLNGAADDEKRYAIEVEAGLKQQRIAAYRYFFTNLRKAPKGVMMELVVRTLRNKISSMLNGEA